MASPELSRRPKVPILENDALWQIGSTIRPTQSLGGAGCFLQAQSRAAKHRRLNKRKQNHIDDSPLMFRVEL